MADERDEPGLRFEVPDGDGAEQAMDAVREEEPPADDEPLPDEADPADVMEQRTSVPDAGEDDAR
jgi:hypothetical protein